MKKLPYIRQGQQLTIDILNGIIKAINSSILERKEYDSMMADITRMFNSYQSKVDNFISKYQDVVDNTPGLMDLLQSYSTLASMVNGTYVASVGSVNITAAGFNIQGTMGRVQFEDEKNYAQTYPQYSSLLITEVTGATTLVYNVAPFESTPIWIEMDAIAGPQGPQGEPGPQGPDGEPGVDGEPGQITSIKGKKASLEECLGLGVAPTAGDAYVVETDGGSVTLYVYFDDLRPHADPNSWVALNNIRGPAGPQGEMAEISIQYSNYADGSFPSDVYQNHSFMIISENAGNTRHAIKLAPRIEFRIVDIEEKTTATTPSTEVSRINFPERNETIINTKITIPYLRTVESASLVGNNLHLKYRGIEETTPVGRVVYDPSQIIFTDGIAGLDTNTLKNGDVVIDTSDNYKVYNFNGAFEAQGALQGPPGPVGPVGASFNLVGNWVTYGVTSTGSVTPGAGNVGSAYFLPENDGTHLLGLYVSSETSPGVYDWVFAGNSQGPQGEKGSTGDIGPRGTRITAGVAFYYDEEGNLRVPPNTSDTYKQNDLYLNTTSWDLFQVTAIGPASDYTISATYIGNIKGLGVTNITVDEAAENLTIKYSGGSTTVVPIRTIRVADTEYSKAGFVVHRTDLSAKGIFAVDNTIGAQSDPAVPDSFTIWGNAANLKVPGTANAGSSPLIPRADHVHPAQTTITGLAGSATKLAAARTIGLSGVTATAQSFNGTAAITIPITAVPATLLTGTASIPTTGNAGTATRLGTEGTAATPTQLVLGNGKAPATVGSTTKPIYLNAGVPTAVTATVGSTTQPIYLNAGVPAAVTLPTATTSASGLMSSGDKTKLNGLAPPTYDKVIRNQTEFNALIADPDWLDAVSVALVGGPFTLSTVDNIGVKIPATVKQIHGYNGAKITITNFVYHETNAKGGLWYDTLPTTNEYNIRDLEVDCTGTKNGYGFRYCANLTNCTGTGAGTGTGDGYGFMSCKNLTDCTGTGDSYGHGFRYCTNLTNCTGTGAGVSFGADGRGFSKCTNLTNCTGEGTGQQGYGFDDCANLTNCTGTGTGPGASGYGFNECTNLTNCTGTGTGTAKGYGFSSISYASNCKDGGSSTAMWKGINRNINVETCRKTPIEITPTELTTLNA